MIISSSFRSFNEFINEAFHIQRERGHMREIEWVRKVANLSEVTSTWDTMVHYSVSLLCSRVMSICRIYTHIVLALALDEQVMFHCIQFCMKLLRTSTLLSVYYLYIAGYIYCKNKLFLYCKYIILYIHRNTCAINVIWIPIWYLYWLE